MYVQLSVLCSAEPRVWLQEQTDLEGWLLPFRLLPAPLFDSSSRALIRTTWPHREFVPVCIQQLIAAALQNLNYSVRRMYLVAHYYKYNILAAWI